MAQAGDNDTPQSSATITVRIVKSFEFRTERNLVLHHIDLDSTTVGQLKETARQVIGSWKAYHHIQLDTLKLYVKAHGAKTPNLIINLDHDEWVFKDDCKTLAEVGLEHESEVSFFNWALYETFKQNPEIEWYYAQEFIRVTVI